MFDFLIFSVVQRININEQWLFVFHSFSRFIKFRWKLPICFSSLRHISSDCGQNRSAAAAPYQCISLAFVCDQIWNYKIHSFGCGRFWWSIRQGPECAHLLWYRCGYYTRLEHAPTSEFDLVACASPARICTRFVWIVEPQLPSPNSK